MASTRIRKTFRYPAGDSDEDDLPQHLDEEEQDKLISSLRTKDNHNNKIYTNVFLTLLVLAALPYLPVLFASRSTYQARFLVLLSLTSLASTAYILKYIPPERPDPKGKRPARETLDFGSDRNGPIRRYLVWMNGASCALLALAALGLKAAGGEVWWGIWLGPGCAFAIVMLARSIMFSVDISTLERLQYRYKGA